MKSEIPNWNSLNHEFSHNSGLQIIVPDTRNLYSHLGNWIDGHGETSLEQVLNDCLDPENEIKIYPFTWTASINDALFDTCAIVLDAQHNNERGSWFEISSFLWTPDALSSWDFADKRGEIIQNLCSKKFNVVCKEDLQEGNIIEVSNNIGDVMTLVVGHSDFKQAVKYRTRSDVVRNGNNPIRMYVGNEHTRISSFDFDTFDRKIVTLQKTAPKIFSSLYEVLRYTEPSIEIELSL